MEIYVKGTGEKEFKPDQIILDFSFRVKEKKYANALEEGTKLVEEYFAFLSTLGFKKEDIKTYNLSVKEDSVYDNSSRKYKKDGYIFSQNATVKFDYDMKRMAEIMEKTAKIKNAPSCRIDFAVKDDKKAQEEILALAYEEAKFQANVIAKAAGLKLKSCIKTSFQPFDNLPLVSRTRYDSRMYSDECEGTLAKASAERIEATFVPEDIKLSTNVYCLWLAE